MRNCAVSEMIRSRCTLIKLSGTTTSPLLGSVPRFLTAFSISDKAGDVVARSRHARDKPATNRIGHGDEHDRNGPRGPHQRGGDRGALAENAVRLELHQRLRERLHARGVAFGIAVLDAKILAEGPALALETFFERLDASLGFRIVAKPISAPTVRTRTASC